jgi:hypothetical protein
MPVDQRRRLVFTYTPRQEPVHAEPRVVASFSGRRRRPVGGPRGQRIDRRFRAFFRAVSSGQRNRQVDLRPQTSSIATA